ncbi:MAG TPA: beta-ketoacyl-[acyl-carrier-protein] synthase II, partial [Burkholderiales bacterium]|nr:beta-ketoacyl-[acyl-carrier-protein] synthase II [Burkholderiales bacterium]
MSLRCYLPAMGLINALGADRESIAVRLFAGDGSGMRSEGGWLLDGEAFVGRVTEELPTIPRRLAMHRSRNNALLLAALSQIDKEVENAIGRYGRTRIGVVLGSSTSGIEEGEIAVAAHAREN